MKRLLIFAVFALGCASTQTELMDPVEVGDSNKEVSEAPAPVSKAPDIEKNPWPDHFRVNIRGVFKGDYGENYSCNWDLDFKREGEFFTITGADDYPELNPATTPEEHRENIKKLVCLLPPFRVRAETLNIVEWLPMNCMAKLRAEIVKYYRLSLSEDEAWEATESDLSFIYELAYDNLTIFWTRWAPSYLIREFREGEDETVRGVTLTTKGKDTVAGEDCLGVNMLSVDKFRGRRFHTTMDYCYSRSLNLNLLVSVHHLSKILPPLIYEVQEIEVFE